MARWVVYRMSVRLLSIADMSVRHPLVQSQVVRYLRRLSRGLEAGHLITFEPDSFATSDQNEIGEQLKHANITWHPLPATPGSPAKNTVKSF